MIFDPLYGENGFALHNDVDLAVKMIMKRCGRDAVDRGEIALGIVEEDARRLMLDFDDIHIQTFPI
jgi:hypothetical protein